MTGRMVAAGVLTSWVAGTVVFEIGRRHGQHLATFRSMLIHRQAVNDVTNALAATQTHGGDCDRAFRQMAAIILDQQVELLAFRGYVTRLETSADLDEEFKDLLAEGGGS